MRKIGARNGYNRERKREETRNMRKNQRSQSGMTDQNMRERKE